ncbi:LysE family translocator [Asticcacaulis sp.]|uniref:LysE family translocator n=1 Tax=Asticcacaulis sp. TaxID=1872648 RepID=UPI002D17D2D6|nr:LysE family translocator [Asticcacaulis sp.]HTM81678.1 LysE family translocator [Asticcacaulis sp.]
MSVETWCLYFAAVFLLSGTPGPNMLHVLSRSVRFGFRRSTAAMLGCGLAVVVALIASAAGLAAVLTASPLLFEIIRYAGVAYLVWLGIKAWMDKGEDAGIRPDGTPIGMSALALFRGGFLVSITNPKLLLFAAAFLPQFINQSAPKFPQFAILIVTFAAIETFWYAMYGLGGQKLAVYLKKPALNKLFNRLTGTLFFGFGFMLLKAKH